MNKQKKQKILQKLEQKYAPDYTPYGRQVEFHGLGHTAQERLFLAGNRCGKTLCGAYEMAMHLTGFYPAWWVGKRFDFPIQAWAASVTKEVTRDILQKIYLEILPADLVIKTTHKASVTGAIDQLEIVHKTGGISILGFKSYDQGRAKFQGTARHIIHLDEEPDIGIYEECLVRTATTKGHIMLTMTPLMGMTDLCARFLEDEENSTKKVVRATWNDALHLQEADKKRLRASLRPHEIKAREQGIPSLGSGMVFPIKEEEICVPRFEINKNWRRVYGLDFGWTNPTAAIWGAYDDVTDTIYIYDIYQRSEVAPSEHAAALQARGDWIAGVCDPSGQAAGAIDGQSLMEIYAEHGVYLTRADNSVEAGLMQMLERMRAGKLKVFADLEGWWREFRLYRRGENGKIVKRNDHFMDATRYLVMSGLPLAKVKNYKSFRRKPSDWRVV